MSLSPVPSCKGDNEPVCTHIPSKPKNELDLLDEFRSLSSGGDNEETLKSKETKAVADHVDELFPKKFHMEDLRHRHSNTKIATQTSKTNDHSEKQCEKKLKLSSTQDETPGNSDESDDERRAYYVFLVLLSVLSFITRFYRIEVPAHVCWDETHFGKMGSWYLNHTFFFDVHPPLGKMLIGFSGYLTGYDGSFPFSKPGDVYEDVNYVGMRMFCATLGSLIVPMSYQIVWHLTQSLVPSIFAACLILFDTGTLTLSRHILLDPILLFFIMASTYCCVKFLFYRERSFSKQWMLWLVLTGTFLSCSIGVKFVGLFIILMVGYTTAHDLWKLLGDLSLSFVRLGKHIATRVMFLIIFPVLMYSLFFSIHFNVLYNSGSGDGFFSSAFQSQLIGNRLYNGSMPQYVAYGSIITLKQRRTGGAYLHSHAHLYPEEHPPRQQQITTYSHKDDNNKWMFKPVHSQAGQSGDIEFVRNGDYVILEHIGTKRNLHSHREQAPLSKRHFQVSGYGQDGHGDVNDVWVVDILGAGKGSKIEPFYPKIQLIHRNVGCVLHSHDKKLPKWGWDQLEATCNPSKKDPNSVWSIEEIEDSRLPNISLSAYKPSFVEKLIESHAIMTQGNSGLKPKEGEVSSRPWQWAINYKGQSFSGGDHRIYLLGNPVIFGFLLVAKVFFILFWITFKIRQKRKGAANERFQDYCDRTFKACWWLLLGWFIHYAPFWSMTRVLYFHHYFPAFLFSAMFGGVFLNFIITILCVSVPERMMVKVHHWCLFLILGSLIFSFYLFHPLVYGMSGPLASKENSSMHGLKWMESWDI